MKTYLTIMQETLKREINKNEKPDLSFKDWNFIVESLVTLDRISKAMDTINPEYFKFNCESYFEIMESLTGYNIISKEEDK